MKIEVTEEKIKSYHNDACQSFKTRIEKDFPTLFEPTLEVGKWYKSTEYNKFLICFKKDASFSNYGFNVRGDWSNQLGMCFKYSFTLATEEEVSTALIAEAKKRGYKSGNHECLTFFDAVERIKEEFFFEHGKVIIGRRNLGNLIFDKGLWAEIIKKEPVYEWQYVCYDSRFRRYTVSHWFYKSKKEFLKTMPNLKPLHKVKESKRIRE
jgi:hypothetical protein